MRQADIPYVARIESETYEFPWSAGIFRDCLLAGYTNFVLDRDSEVVGYGIMSIAAGEAHVLNICVVTEYRREGTGQRLLQRLLDVAKNSGAQRVFLEVRPSNTAAIRLYEKLGFEALGRRENYYKARDGKEDAVVLVLHFSRPLV